MVIFFDWGDWLIDNVANGCCVRISRSFVISVLKWSADITTIDNRSGLVRLWHRHIGSSLSHTSLQCHSWRQDVPSLSWLRYPRLCCCRSVAHKHSDVGKLAVVGEGAPRATAPTLHREWRRRTAIRRQRLAGTTSTVVPQGTTFHSTHTPVHAGL